MNTSLKHQVGDSLEVTCPLCGNADQSVKLAINTPDRFERASNIQAQGYERYWLECKTCGLLNNYYGHDISAIYAGQYYDPAVEGETVRERFSRVLALPNEGSDNWARVQRIASFVAEHRTSQTPGRVLDIGAGTGIFLYRLLEAFPKNQSWSAAAVEPSPQACAHLRSLRDVPGTDPTCCEFDVIEGYYSAANRDITSGSFDLVTLNKVVEHLSDPVTLVREAAQALTAHGVIYVEVPDKATADHRPATDNILGALHYCLFDAQTLANVFTQAGLAPLQIQRYLEPSGKITVSGFAMRSENFVPPNA